MREWGKKGRRSPLPPIETKGGRGRKRENSKFCREENLKQTNKQNVQSQLNSSNEQHITVRIVGKYTQREDDSLRFFEEEKKAKHKKL